jgi:dynein heavy chain 1
LFVTSFFVADEDSDQSGEGDEEKDAVTYCISNEVHFTNPKMARYNLS